VPRPPRGHARARHGEVVFDPLIRTVDAVLGGVVLDAERPAMSCRLLERGDRVHAQARADPRLHEMVAVAQLDVEGTARVLQTGADGPPPKHPVCRGAVW